MTLKQKVFIVGLLLAFIIVSALILMGFNSADRHSLNFDDESHIEVRSLIEGTRNVPDLTVNATLPVVPKEVMIYTIKRGIDHEEFHRIATELGIQGEEKEEYGFLIVRNDPYQLDAELSSGVLYYQNKSQQPGYDDMYIKNHLPHDIEAQKIADDFLASRNLRPKDAVFLDTTHNEGYLLSNPPEKCSESMNVEYSHQINGSNILTDQLRVEIGVDGTILNMFKKWTIYESYKKNPVITPVEAIHYLKKTGIVIPSGMKDPQKATVTSISFGYIGETQTKKLLYLIPIYSFEGVVQGADGKSATFYQWIPATPELAAEIT